MPFYDVFIAYETASTKERAKFLKENLIRFGIHAFEAQGDLEKGEDWRKNRNTALEESHYLVALVTTYVLVSDEFQYEFETACKQRKRLLSALK